NTEYCKTITIAEKNDDKRMIDKQNNTILCRTSNIKQKNSNNVNKKRFGRLRNYFRNRNVSNYNKCDNMEYDGGGDKFDSIDISTDRSNRISISSDRIGSDRIGSDRIGSDRIGSEDKHNNYNCENKNENNTFNATFNATNSATDNATNNIYDEDNKLHTRVPNNRIYNIFNKNKQRFTDFYNSKKYQKIFKFNQMNHHYYDNKNESNNTDTNLDKYLLKKKKTFLDYMNLQDK
ncbi:conserved protein, unknown function, partial [Hepatocystis sp. ex Piliocolobus tephrosceles]